MGDNGTAGIRYSLTGDGSQYFCIDPLTAVIKLCQGPLNRETEPNYQLQVTNCFKDFLKKLYFPGIMYQDANMVDRSGEAHLLCNRFESYLSLLPFSPFH